MNQRRIDMSYALLGIVIIINGVCLILRSPLTPATSKTEPEQTEVTYPVQWNSNLYATANAFVTNLYFSTTNIIVKSSERIVQELIEGGFTPEDAREAYRIISGMAAEKREEQ